MEKTENPKFNFSFDPFLFDSVEYSAIKLMIYDRKVLSKQEFCKQLIILFLFYFFWFIYFFGLFNFIFQIVGQVIIPIYDVKENGGKLENWFYLNTDTDNQFVSGSIHVSLAICQRDKSECELIKTELEIESSPTSEKIDYNFENSNIVLFPKSKKVYSCLVCKIFFLIYFIFIFI